MIGPAIEDSIWLVSELSFTGLEGNIELTRTVQGGEEWSMVGHMVSLT